MHGLFTNREVAMHGGCQDSILSHTITNAWPVYSQISFCFLWKVCTISFIIETTTSIVLCMVATASLTKHKAFHFNISFLHVYTGSLSIPDN